MANRGIGWTDTEIKALLATWGDERIQAELDGAVRNRSVFEKIAKAMSDAAHQRDWKQCRQKIKNLKNDYKKVKDSKERDVKYADFMMN